MCDVFCVHPQTLTSAKFDKKRNPKLTSHSSELTMEEDPVYGNVEIFRKVYVEPRKEKKGLGSSDRRTVGVAVVSLGVLCVLLLVGLVYLGVHHKSTVDDLTEHLQTCENTSSSLSVQRDLENQELQRLRSQFTGMMFCPAGWLMFDSSCYEFSNWTRSWDDSRIECRKSGADLVIINSPKEQEFLYKMFKHNSWMGLSDRDSERNWKWVDGSPVSVKYWRDNQPDNGGGNSKYGEEDCGAFEVLENKDKNWNDLNCDKQQHWICEKRALVFNEK